ncbi:hypothetical protein [Amycolatopsis sp. NPDC058986]|uniref:hypothetical protein n=1 Tax=unclassified Amycolatopsis TaxID=2618356 RepID=UPI003671D7E1
MSTEYDESLARLRAVAAELERASRPTSAQEATVELISDVVARSSGRRSTGSDGAQAGPS